VQDEFGATPLHYAIAERSPEMAHALIAHGADGSIQNREGKTPLHSAIEYGLFSVVEALIAKDPSAVGIADHYGNQPLWAAAFNARGRYDFVRLLLANGADVNHKNEAGLTPKDVPRRLGDLHLLEILDRHGAADDSAPHLEAPSE